MARNSVTQMDARRKLAQMEARERRRIRRKWHIGTFGHFLTVFFTLIIAIIVVVAMVVGQFLTGPSSTATDIMAQTLMQTSALKFVPYLYLFENTDAVIARNTVLSSNQVTDASLVTIKAHLQDETDDPAAETESFDENGIRVEKVVGPTYRGYMMIVRDPSRVFVGVSNSYFTKDKPGKYVYEIIDKYNALAGINGGAFSDSKGSGNGGEALGLSYSEGTRMTRADGAKYKTVVGFDQNDILHVGDFTIEEADAIGLRDAVAFGPALVVNGEGLFANVAADKSVQPRSVIGQRADGAVLLLVIDGRQANSLGASYTDLINVMLNYGAVNACNLDGGSSTVMYYHGEQLNDGMTISNSRRMPTAWIVR